MKRTLSQRSRAFSVLEMVVACLILVLAFVIAGSLLTEVHAHVAWSGEALTNQVPERACEQLRADFHASSGNSTGSDVFLPVPLDFTVNGRVITYATDEEGRLERSLYDPATEKETSRPVLDNVVSFQWRNVGRAVEVEIVSWRSAPPNIGPKAAAGQQSVERLLRVDRVMMAPRRITTQSF